jgi:hypothetical protein
VLKTIFSLVKKLLHLPGQDAAKEFITTYNQTSKKDKKSNKAFYDSSGSSGTDLDP